MNHLLVFVPSESVVLSCDGLALLFVSAHCSVVIVLKPFHATFSKSDFC